VVCDTVSVLSSRQGSRRHHNDLIWIV